MQYTFMLAIIFRECISFDETIALFLYVNSCKRNRLGKQLMFKEFNTWRNEILHCNEQYML